MITKEELLLKGISEELADEIIASSEENPDENSLQALQKALEVSDDETLFKANGGEKKKDEEEDDKDYNEEYMKKYMRRYMSENKKSCSKMAKDVGLFGEKMQKAVDELDPDTEGGIVEMIDLAPILKDQLEFNNSMAKAVDEISGQIALISARSEQSFDLMQKAAAVQVEQANGLSEFLSEPQGRKSKDFAVDANMQKAADLKAISPEGNKEIYKVLMKAVKSGDQKAGQVISAFESANHNANRLNAPQKEYISDLMKEEAN